jgi:hypothetical protein
VAIRSDTSERRADVLLDEDFSSRLELALGDADAVRRRRQWQSRLARAASVALLIGPLLAWKLIGASPGGEHVVVDALVWLTFLLDAGVQVDSATLSYLHLQAVPVIVGLILLVVIGLWLLGGTEVSE